MYVNTKLHSQMGGTPGHGWKLACRLATLTEDSVACSVPVGKFQDYYLISHRDDYLPHPVQLIQHYNPQLLTALAINQ
jgi:hypothetical protein